MLGVKRGLAFRPNGRSAGTVTWAGIFNTYYWIDPAKRVAGVFMTQTLPFAEPRSVDRLPRRRPQPSYGSLGGGRLQSQL